MKYLNIALVCVVGFCSMAQAQESKIPVVPQIDQEKLTLLAGDTGKCLLEKVPEKWEQAFAVVDRTDPKKPLLYAQAKLEGKDETVAITPCDVKKQADLILNFVQLIPADQQNWKQLFYRVSSNGDYIVFTDIEALRSQTKNTTSKK